MLTQSELSQVLGLVSTDGNSLDWISSEFNSMFPQSDHFKLSSGLTLMVEAGPSLLSLKQRIAVYYILYSAFNDRKQSSSSSSSSTSSSIDWASFPFLSIYLGVLERQSEWAEACFVALLLSGNMDKKLTESTPGDVITALGSVQMPTVDVTSLKQLLVSQQPQFPASNKIGIGTLAADPEVDIITGNIKTGSSSSSGSGNSGGEDTSGAENNEKGEEDPLTSYHLGETELDMDRFGPTFVRAAPTLLEPDTDEVFWLNPEMTHDVQWDFAMCVDTSKGNELRELMSFAFQSPLSPSQQSKLLAELGGDQDVVLQSGMMPAKLPSLVENNPIVAIEVLLLLINGGGNSNSKMDEYYDELVSMDMSLHSMEVVNKLTSTVELPKDVVHRYISHCIASCNNIKDKYMQNRLVRLVCVFLQTLVRNKIIDIRDLLTEVQGFCFEFSKIREAAGLFRLLKSLDQ
eukprot:TRINITY_DN4982_c0_g1_i11.p1 TRINITY_DN4982_c0_g1~~TRINITY_DN4982_c0_g1_i11.p1  ORF type:complete len:470 (-),score=123.26 TRINITY_DN4982_c0_g1_i11:15-1394(-)